MSFATISIVGGSVVGAGLLGGAINNIGQSNYAKNISAKQNEEADKINPLYDNSYVETNLANAKNQVNSLPAWARLQEQQNAVAQFNAMYGVNRNATNSSQALAMAAAGQGMADDANTKLAEDVEKYKETQQQNLTQALMAANQNMWQKYATDKQTQDALRNSAYQNRNTSFQNWGNFANQVTNLGSSVLGYALRKTK